MKRVLAILISLLSMLAVVGCGQTKGEDWVLKIEDSNGNPIEGVSVQVCSDKVCKLLVTDEAGKIDFDGDENSYEVHIMSAPDGYEINEDSYTWEKGVATTITLCVSETTAQASSEEDKQYDAEIMTEEGTDRKKICFSSVDMNGNTVDDSIFAENKVTMINLWEPWCGPCKQEMPYLEQLYQEYKDKGFTILGIHEYMEDLEQVVSDSGVTYPIVKTTDEFLSIVYDTGAYPTTFFVDSEGYIITPAKDELEQDVLDAEENMKAVLEMYQNGEFDEYKDNPYYADYFATLDDLIIHPEKIRAYAEEEVASSTGSGYYIGGNTYESWKTILETQYERVNKQ